MVEFAQFVYLFIGLVVAAKAFIYLSRPPMNDLEGELVSAFLATVLGAFWGFILVVLVCFAPVYGMLKVMKFVLRGRWDDNQRTH
jgi:hypothetical protein